MAEDLALDRINAIYRAKEFAGMDHGRMVVVSVKILADELTEVRELVATCPTVAALADRYIQMALVELDEIDRRLLVLDGSLRAVEAAEKLGKGAVEVTESFVQTCAMVIIALCVNAYRFLSFARALVEEEHRKSRGGGTALN